MSIYTKTGDSGETSLFGGKRVKKYDKTVSTHGALDELSSFVGLAGAEITENKDKKLLLSIQKNLYLIMCLFCQVKVELIPVANQVKEFEHYIDNAEKKLPRLTRFILPGGTVSAGWFHVLRTICRRAERQTVLFFDKEKTLFDKKSSVIILKYLNRLSDLFFIMARKYNNGKELVT